VTLPSFRTYLRVIFHRPAWSWIPLVFGLVLGFFSVWLNFGGVGVVIGIAAGFLFVAAAFPWWRRRVVKDPAAYTWGRPELLAKDVRTPD